MVRLRCNCYRWRRESCKKPPTSLEKKKEDVDFSRAASSFAHRGKLGTLGDGPAAAFTLAFRRNARPNAKKTQERPLGDFPTKGWGATPAKRMARQKSNKKRHFGQ